MIHLDEAAVERGEYRKYCPEKHDFRWGPDYKTVTIVPLSWWDDASYARYQGDTCRDDE